MKATRRPRPAPAATAAAAINIGPRERLKRRILGIVSLIAGAGLAFILIAFHAPIFLRLIVFFPLWMAGLGLFQAREKT